MGSEWLLVKGSVRDTGVACLCPFAVFRFLFHCKSGRKCTVLLVRKRTHTHTGGDSTYLGSRWPRACVCVCVRTCMLAFVGARLWVLVCVRSSTQLHHVILRLSDPTQAERSLTPYGLVFADVAIVTSPGSDTLPRATLC